MYVHLCVTLEKQKNGSEFTLSNERAHAKHIHITKPSKTETATHQCSK